MGSVEIQRRRDYLFAKHPFCHYCEIELVSYRLRQHERPPDNFAVLHHMRNRLHPFRGERPRNGELRRVLACLACADLIARAEESALPIEEIRERAGRFPKSEVGENGQTSS